ncbi:MAG TPA: KGG domain-containing protein [Fimbriimonadaceae bacterium]|nr:KGG domain-containing protein [Fimbriimonadaceae bacterium]
MADNKGNRGTENSRNGSSERGFASMDEAKQREIAKKGGEAVSENRSHMAQIGQRGGEAVSRDRNHMAEIGRKGGEASHGSQRKSKNSENSKSESGGRGKS